MSEGRPRLSRFFRFGEYETPTRQPSRLEGGALRTGGGALARGRGDRGRWCQARRAHSPFSAFSLDDFCSDAQSPPRIRDDQRVSDLVLRCERRRTSISFSLHRTLTNAIDRGRPRGRKSACYEKDMDGDKLRLLGDSIAQTVAAIDRTEHHWMALLWEFDQAGAGNSMVKRVWWRGCRIGRAWVRARRASMCGWLWHWQGCR